jgi:hypothetical protein
MTRPTPDTVRRAWALAHWLLTAAFLITAFISIQRIPAGFLSSYAADLTCPAWLYIGLRGLHGPKRPNRLGRFFGATPERAAGFVFGGSALTEVSQLWWPHGLFRGTFDVLDIVAYGTGVGLCYLFDKITDPEQPAVPPAAR